MRFWISGKSPFVSSHPLWKYFKTQSQDGVQCQVSLAVVVPCPQQVTPSRRTLTPVARLHCHWKQKWWLSSKISLRKAALWTDPSEKQSFLFIIVPSVQPFHLLGISLDSFQRTDESSCPSDPCHPWPAAGQCSPARLPAGWLVLPKASEWSVYLGCSSAAVTPCRHPAVAPTLTPRTSRQRTSSNELDPLPSSTLFCHDS